MLESAQNPYAALQPGKNQHDQARISAKEASASSFRIRPAHS
jgi:hypothetical protein